MPLSGENRWQQPTSQQVKVYYHVLGKYLRIAALRSVSGNIRDSLSASFDTYEHITLV